MFINVNKKYDWDNLSDTDIVALIEDKIQKEKDKLIHDWSDAGIRVEKARWGRHHVIKGKVKVELPKTHDVSEMTLEEAEAIIEKNAPKKKTRKTTKKSTSAKKEVIMAFNVLTPVSDWVLNETKSLSPQSMRYKIRCHSQDTGLPI